MEEEIERYINEKFVGFRTEKRNHGNNKASSVWFIVWLQGLMINIVIYPKKNLVGIDLVDDKSIPFTGHDEVFNNTKDTISFIENNNSIKKCSSKLN